MSTWHDVRDLLSMYSAGGMVIMTGMDGKVLETAVSPPSSTYDGRIYDQKGIRTTIQLDSDYVTVLSLAVLQQPHIWQSHMHHVDAKLAVLDKLHIWARQSWLLFMIIPLAWYGYDLANMNSLAEVWALIGPTLLSFVIVLARKWILRLLQATVLPLLMRVVVWLLKRRFNAFVGGTAVFN